MKKFFVFALSLPLLFASCNDSLIEEIKEDIPDNPVTGPLVTYSNMSCELPDGTDGCECIVTQLDDDCSVQTECIRGGALYNNYQNYRDALLKMFTEEEIQQRNQRSARIVEPELIEALLKDGFPIKP